MKSLGVVRKIDDLGRIVLPMELRKTMDIKEGDALEIFTENERIILKKYLPTCIYCQSSERLTQFHGYNICPSCINELKKL